MTRRTGAKLTLMPVIALAGLSLLAGVPLFASLHAYAAPPQHFATVTVRPGDTLWSLAADRTPSGGSVDELIDRISATNGLRDGEALRPGQRLLIPD
jgi:predicted Zn-dependent protease